LTHIEHGRRRRHAPAVDIQRKWKKHGSILQSAVDTERASKVPEVTLGFWIIKILATTLGETGGDAVTMSMNLGYLAGTAIFAAIFAAGVTAQMKREAISPAALTGW